ncbi:ABC transporter substrate-binding protein [Hydrogenophaga sp. IBVHS1]|uniref:ABC transporter substrate-binding protein n=1 Tax=unclassified Hydrogenophaga TaxID=2610897 RepID=UPI000A2E0EDF|nr:ABC transporter substrate-binding protein [Hydrogenophaga sp. IBVHS1]OSZ76342.1 ABC transporter permease [Hydrogenophaga sp. IBVHS1]
MQRRLFLTTSAAAVSALTAPAVWSQSTPKLTPIKFTLDFRITGQTSPFFLAQQRGYYKDEGLDVSIDVGSGSVASITRIASGVYQMGLGDISSLVEFQASQIGTPLVQAVYQYYNRAPFAIIGRKDRGITTDFRSLEGKKIAAAAVESTRRAWPMVARKLRVKDDYFQWSTTDFASRDNVVVRGDVDGATYFHDSAVSLFARMKLDDLSILQYTQAGVNLYGNAILASNAMVTQNPTAVAGFLRATNRAIRESMADPAAAIAATKLREPILNEAVELERWRITRQYIAAADTRSHGVGDVLKRTLEQQVDEVVEVFGLKTRPGVEGVFNRAMLPPLSERMYTA